MPIIINSSLTHLSKYVYQYLRLIETQYSHTHIHIHTTSVEALPQSMAFQ